MSLGYRDYRKHPNDWTPHEDDLLLTYAGARRLATLAKQIGRSPQSVEKRLRQHGIYVREAATRRAGMSIQDVADALGVSKTHVRKWITAGWLVSQHAFGTRRRYVSIDPDAVLFFLRERGALLPNIRPDRDWADEVASARACLAARLIAGPDLARAMFLHRGTLSYLRSRLDFPDPALRFGGCLPDYYDRAAVRGWLLAHPQYRVKESP